jgi:hypothetical protein
MAPIVTSLASIVKQFGIGALVSSAGGGTGSLQLVESLVITLMVQHIIEHTSLLHQVLLM